MRTRTKCLWFVLSAGAPIFVVACLLLPPTGFGSDHSSTAQISVLAAGCVYKHALPTTNREGWWVLCTDGAQTAARRTTVSVSDLRAEGHDTDVAEVTAVGCSVDNVIFLFRGLDAAREGLVETVASKKSLYGWPLKTQAISLRMGTRTYVLVTEWGQVRKGREQEMPPYKVTLSSGETEHQVLAEIEETNDAGPYLDWAGDLDHDGQLDLALRTPIHYCSADSDIYLSSLAGEGELVKKIGTIENCGGD